MLEALGPKYSAFTSITGSPFSVKGAETTWRYKVRRWDSQESVVLQFFHGVFRQYGSELSAALLRQADPAHVVQYEGQINHLFFSTMLRLQHELTPPTIAVVNAVGHAAAKAEAGDMAVLVDIVRNLWRAKKDANPTGPPPQVDRDELLAAMLADLESTYFSPRGILLTDFENAQVQARLEHIIHTGVEQGWTVRRVAEEIESGIGGMYSGTRAMAIARTEVPALFNRCNFEAMMNAGCIAAKIWLAVMDERTRDTHLRADGQQVPLNERFRVNGVYMMYPGDPAGGPREVCNCRCSMLPVVATQYVPQNTSNSDILDALVE